MYLDYREGDIVSKDKMIMPVATWSKHLPRIDNCITSLLNEIGMHEYRIVVWLDSSIVD